MALATTNQSAATNDGVPTTSTSSTYDEVMEEQKRLLPAPVVGVPVGGQAKVTSVQLTLVQHDGRFVFPDTYSLELTGKLSQEELAAIIAELNATALEYGPNRSGARMLLAFIPVFNIATHFVWQNQYNTMLQKLHDTCNAINRRYLATAGGGGGGSTANLLYREVPRQRVPGCRRRCGPGATLAQVEVQVMGA